MPEWLRQPEVWNGGLGALLGLFILLSVLLLFTRLCFKRVTVWEYEAGLLYKNGQFRHLLGPGRHRVWRWGRDIKTVDQRAAQLVVASQDILTADPLSLKASVVVTYEVDDAVKALHSAQSYTQALYISVQIAVRTLVAKHKLEELLDQRTLSLRQDLVQLLTAEATAIGLRVVSADVRDLILPGDLKKAFSEVVRAQKEGLAALERARGESAALRNLANAAKMLEHNPHLLQLRVLQTIAQGDKPGNTLVWGMPIDTVSTLPKPPASPPEASTFTPTDV